MDEETVSSGSPGQPRRQSMLWAGVGVLVAGIGVLGYALGVADDVYPMAVGDPPDTKVVEQYRPGLTSGFAAVCGVLAVPTLVWVLVVAWLSTTGRARAYPLPALLPVVGILLFWGGVFSYNHWVEVSEVPFPGDRALLVTSAYGFVLVGTLVVHDAATRMWWSPAAPRGWSRRDVVGFAAGVTAVALAAGATVAVAGEPARVDATTAAAVQAPPAPTEPTRVLWRWSNASLREVVAAGAGIVASSAEGLVALDGRTGQERWHYRRTDTSPRGMSDELGAQHDSDKDFLVAVDGGRGVIVSLEGRLHAFDAFTGELRWRDDGTTAQAPPPWDGEIVATDSTVVRYRGSPEPEYAGTDVRTGELTWRYPSEHPWCETEADAIGDTVIIRYECDGPYDLVVGLDGASGELLWSRSGGADLAGDLITLETEDDVVLDPRSGRQLGPAPARLVLLASDAGEILTSEGSLFEVGSTAPRWEVPDASPATSDWRDATAATFLGDAALLVNDRSCPGQGDGLELIVVDRADGRVRRSFECADLQAEYSISATEVITAPGAVVVHGRDELVGVG